MNSEAAHDMCGFPVSRCYFLMPLSAAGEPVSPKESAGSSWLSVPGSPWQGRGPVGIILYLGAGMYRTAPGGGVLEPPVVGIFQVSLVSPGGEEGLVLQGYLKYYFK